MTRHHDHKPFRYHVNRKFKDSLFRLIFSDRKDALELYNALNDSSYEDPDLLEITTIDDVIYMGIKNDLSFLIEGEMYLLEEQSSWSENMPLRGLFYFSNLYQSYVAAERLDIYAGKRLSLPRPVYVIFYIGAKAMPEQMTLRLSDSFQKTDGDHEPAIEVVARVFNVNYGKNRVLMERCRRLSEYSYLIHRVRYYTDQGLILEAAMELAIEDCIRQDILKEFLIKHREEVCSVILTKYDEAFHIQCEKEQSYVDGLEAGSDQTRREIVRAMLANGVSHEVICRSASITEEELVEILEGTSER